MTDARAAQSAQVTAMHGVQDLREQAHLSDTGLCSVSAETATRCRSEGRRPTVTVSKAEMILNAAASGLRVILYSVKEHDRDHLHVEGVESEFEAPDLLLLFWRR